MRMVDPENGVTCNDNQDGISAHLLYQCLARRTNGLCKLQLMKLPAEPRFRPRCAIISRIRQVFGSKSMESSSLINSPKRLNTSIR